MWSFVLAVAIVLSFTPTWLNQSLAAESAGPTSALARLQALAGAYPQGVPVTVLRTSLRSIVDQARAESETLKLVCRPTPTCPCSLYPRCPTPGYLSGPTRPDLDTARVHDTVIQALKALEWEARATTGTISASRFETLVGSLELATQAAQK